MTNENKKFVIQQHSSGLDVHWDFMLEIGDILQTYRLDKAPQELLQTPANAVKIFDHPLKFLTYEGPVNKGRGSVRIADSGTYEILSQSADRLELDLNGKILKGKFTLSHIEGDNWQFGKSGI
jgi:bifunctional non-homologous end joining protein LigD